jgi:hypothetical protein
MKKKKDLKIETTKNPSLTNQQSKENNSENQAKSKKKIFIEKFNIQKELLNRDDIKSILNELNPGTAENIQQQSDIIFEKLDKNNLGFVKTDDLMKSLISGNENKDADEELVEFYKKLNNILKTKSEEIMFRLKKLQTRSWVKNNPELSSKLKKVILEITTQQLSDVILDDENIKKKQKEDVSFLMKYSQIETHKQKAEDLQAYRRQSKKYSSYIEMNNNMNLVNSSDEVLMNNTLSTMISPSIIARLNDQMEKISSCDFDIFELNALLGKKTSIYLASEILGHLSLVDNGDVPQNILSDFIKEIIAHYDRNKAIYHNDLHAGDVMQTVYTIFVRGNIGFKMKLSELDIFSILVAALCHDFKHPGTNNAYNINARTKYAMRYNDLHVLESYHIAQTFKVLSKKEFNIFQNFSPEEYRISRRRMIDAVISTDMAKHTKVLTAAKTKSELYDIVNGNNFTKIFDDIPDDSKNNKQLLELYNRQQCLLNMIVHTSDISNPAKPDKVSAQWTQRVYDEFFVQGDMEKEKNLPVSNFCDRNTTNVNKAMIGFISFVVGPTINCLVNLIPEVKDYKDYCESNLRKHQRGAKEDDKLLILSKKKKEEEKKNNKQ